MLPSTQYTTLEVDDTPDLTDSTYPSDSTRKDSQIPERLRIARANFPIKRGMLGVFLLVTGLVLLITGVVLIFSQTKSASWMFILFGMITFAPGLWVVRILWHVWHGTPGFHYGMIARLR